MCNSVYLILIMETETFPLDASVETKVSHDITIEKEFMASILVWYTIDFICIIVICNDFCDMKNLQ